jgi:hypothetical protein
LLLAPAIWNGYPLLQYDTGGYLARWYEGYLVPSRSTSYGIYLHLGETSRFVVNLLLQALATVFVIRALLRVFDLDARGPLIVVGVSLCLLTALPFLASMLITDIFAGLSVLSLFLLVVHPDRFSRLETLGLFVLTAFSAASHSATFGVLFGLCWVGWVMSPWLSGILTLRGLMAGALSVAAGAAMLIASNYALSGKASWTPGGSGVLFARMLEDGLVARYLNDHCDTEVYRLCPYRNDLPKTADDFLWGKSVFNDLGRFDGLGPEMSRIVAKSLFAYPVAQAKAAATATGRQLVAVATGEGCTNWLAHTYGIFERYLPQELQAMRNARQQRSELSFSAVNRVHVAIALVSTFGVFAIVGYRLFRRRLDPFAVLAVTVAVALLGNAFLCAAVSGPHDRYGARIVWIGTLVLVVGALSVARNFGFGHLCQLTARGFFMRATTSRTSG